MSGLIEVPAEASTVTQTAQQVYTNSTNPVRVITDATRGPLVYQGGSGSDTDNIMEFKNNAGTLTGFIKGDGTSSFVSIAARKESFLFEDFGGVVSLSPFTGSSGALNTVNNGVSGQVGHIRMRAAAVAGSYAGYSSCNNDLVFGAGTWSHFSGLNIVNLYSAGVREYIYTIGYGDVIVAGDYSDGVYFEYDGATSGNWRICTANGGVRTKVTTSVAASTSYVNLAIEINAAGTSAQFFINGTSVGTITTNIPTSNPSGYNAQIRNVTGVGQSDVHIDYYGSLARFTANYRS